MKGISLGSFRIAGFQIEKLYLKLDKRLILKAERVRIPHRKETPDFRNILENGPGRLHLLLRFFDSIELKDVEFSNDHYSLLYADHILYLQSRSYEIAGMVSQTAGGLELNVPLFYLRKYDLTLQGKLFYRYRTGAVTTEGSYRLPDVRGDFHAEAMGKRVRFWLDSKEVHSLKRFSSMLPVDPVAKEWIGKRIRAQSYRLEYLSGEGSFDTEGDFHPDLVSLQGALLLRKARIDFADKLKKIRAQKVRAVLKNGGIYFTLEKPRYGNKAIDGSSVALVQLERAEDLKLLLRLRYHGRFDWDLIRILKYYGIPVEIGQKSGIVQVKIALDIPLGKGETKVQGAVRFSPGILEYHGMEWKTEGGAVAFTHDRLRLDRVTITEPVFRGAFSGVVDLPRRKADLESRVDRLRLGEKTPWLKILDQRFKIRVAWDPKEVRVSIPSLRAEARFGKSGGMELRLGDLKLLRPWIVEGSALLAGGELRIRSTDRRSFTFSGVLELAESPFYTVKGSLRKIPFLGSYDGTKLRITALDGRLRYDGATQTLFLRGINVDGKKLTDFLAKLDGENSGPDRSQLHVRGVKSLIRYGRYVLVSDSYRLDKQGGDFTFSGVLGKDRVLVDKTGKRLEISAKEIGDRMLHSLIHFNGLQGGRYSFHLLGTIGGEYRGEILIRGGVLKDFKAYNDMIALFNTIPALMSFSSPGFSDKGFELLKGKILFHIKGDQLRFDSIELLGKSSTVAGKGSVDLASGKLDIELGVQTAREVGKTLGNVPLVGYILFGKDKSLTAGVKIGGTLEKPKVHTNPVGDALLYPLELLKRTLMAPAVLVNPVPKKAISAPVSSVPKMGKENNQSTETGTMY